MWWFTWRQIRAQTYVTGTLLVAAAAALAVTGVRLAHLWTDSGASACTTSCAGALRQFQDLLGGTNLNGWYDTSTIALYVTPILIGIFWGGPLVARELEAGTHRLAWNQSVTRSRWLTTKLLLGGGLALTAVAVLTVGITVWAQHLDRDSRIEPLLFGARGIVPAGHVLFAFALGVTAGALVRRTVPAMAITLGGYVVVLVTMALLIRSHLAPVRHAFLPLDLNRLTSMRIDINGPINLVGEPDIPGWVLTNETVTPAGAVFNGPADPAHCGQGLSEHSCTDWIASLHLRQSVTYQPMSHFWPLQLIEAAIYVVLAAALIGVCARRVRRLT